MLPLSYNLHVPGKLPVRRTGGSLSLKTAFRKVLGFWWGGLVGCVVWWFYFGLGFKGKIRSTIHISCFQGHFHRQKSWNNLKPQIKCYLNIGSIW